MFLQTAATEDLIRLIINDKKKIFITGVPLVIVSLVLAIDKDVYGSLSPEDAAVALESDQPL